MSWPGRLRGCDRLVMGLVGRSNGLGPRLGADVHDQVFEVQVVIDREPLGFRGSGEDRRISIRPGRGGALERGFVEDHELGLGLGCFGRSEPSLWRRPCTLRGARSTRSSTRAVLRAAWPSSSDRRPQGSAGTSGRLARSEGAGCSMWAISRFKTVAPSNGSRPVSRK